MRQRRIVHLRGGVTLGCVRVLQVRRTNSRGGLGLLGMLVVSMGIPPPSKAPTRYWSPSTTLSNHQPRSITSAPPRRSPQVVPLLITTVRGTYGALKDGGEIGTTYDLQQLLRVHVLLALCTTIYILINNQQPLNSNTIYIYNYYTSYLHPLTP